MPRNGLIFTNRKPYCAEDIQSDHCSGVTLMISKSSSIDISKGLKMAGKTVPKSDSV